MPPSPSFLERFEARLPDVLDDSRCWIWQGRPSSRGYGRISLSGHKERTVYAHRVAWEMHHAEPIPKDMVVMHACDTPLCVNPLHLHLGTHLDNQQDKARKGRGPKGIINGRVRLTAEQVLSIRDACDRRRATQRQLARQFGVCKTTIAKIARRETWSHLA